MENDAYGKTDHAQWASPLLARHRFAAVACARCLYHWHVWTKFVKVRHSHSFSSTSGGDDVRLQRRSWARLCECHWWLFSQLPFCLDLLQHPTVRKKRLKLSLGLHPSSWIVTVLRLAHSFSVFDPSACRSFRRQWRKAKEHQDQTIYVTCNLTMDFLQNSWQLTYKLLRLDLTSPNSVQSEIVQNAAISKMTISVLTKTSKTSQSYKSTPVSPWQLSAQHFVFYTATANRPCQSLVL